MQEFPSRHHLFSEKKRRKNPSFSSIPIFKSPCQLLSHSVPLSQLISSLIVERRKRLCKRKLTGQHSAAFSLEVLQTTLSRVSCQIQWPRSLECSRSFFIHFLMNVVVEYVVSQHNSHRHHCLFCHARPDC